VATAESSKTPPTPKRGERGTGTTITIDLHEHASLLTKIREAAKADDREPSKFLRRIIVKLDEEGKLFKQE
jgi:hypothetical protein